MLLVEAKSYPGELRSKGLAASSAQSRATIERSLKATQDWLNVPEDHRGAWTGRLNQTANRLAHLFWLREVAGVDAWMLHVLFTGDKDVQSTTEREWIEAMFEVDEELGLQSGLSASHGSRDSSGSKERGVSTQPSRSDKKVRCPLGPGPRRVE